MESASSAAGSTSSLGSHEPSPAIPASSAPIGSAAARRRIGPVSRDAMAAITLAAIANQKAIPIPLWNGWVMTFGSGGR
jgi:hypothetical protein